MSDTEYGGAANNTSNAATPPPRGIDHSIDRGVVPHDGLPPAVVLSVDPSGGMGDFVVSVGEPFTSAVVAAPPIVQLSYTSLRMGSMVVEPLLALPPETMSNSANCDPYGVSSDALTQLAGDDPYARAVNLTGLGDYQSALAQVAGGDPSNGAGRLRRQPGRR